MLWWMNGWVWWLLVFLFCFFNDIKKVYQPKLCSVFIALFDFIGFIRFRFFFIFFLSLVLFLILLFAALTNRLLNMILFLHISCASFPQFAAILYGDDDGDDDEMCKRSICMWRWRKPLKHSFSAAHSIWFTAAADASYKSALDGGINVVVGCTCGYSTDSMV